jgi:hypothetical protein
MNKWVWSIGGMILTGENWSAGRKTLYSVGGRWMNEYGALMEWYWQGKTEVLGEKHYTALVVDEWMRMERWWNDTDREKLKNCLEKGIFHCHFLHHKFTWTVLGSNSDLPGKKSATDRMLLCRYNMSSFRCQFEGSDVLTSCYKLPNSQFTCGSNNLDTWDSAIK